MTSKKWTREYFDELMRPYVAHETDPSPQAKKRARILRAATELFEKQGYRKTRIDEIARAAGVAKGTVYLYFENKGMLFVHVIALQKRALMKSFEPLLTGEIPERDRLRFYLEKMLTSAREVPLIAKLLRGDSE